MKNEAELDQLLAGLGLPDDLEEVALQGGPVPGAEAVAHIKAMTLAKAGAGSAPAVRERRPGWRRLAWALAAAVAFVAVATTAVLGPREVLARFLSYVPGFGTRDAGQVNLAAAHPVRLDRENAWVEASGLVADGKWVTVHLRSHNVALERGSLFLEDQSGQAHQLESGSIASGIGSDGSTYDAWMGYQGTLVPADRQATVVVDGAQPWRLTLDLVLGNSLVPADQFGPAATVNGYTIAARVQPYANRADVDLLVQGAPAGGAVSSVGRYFGKLPATRLATLTAGSQTLDLLSAGGSAAMDVKHFETAPLPSDITTVTVQVPVLEVQEPGEAKVKLNVATGPVNRTVKLGRWNLTITRTEVTDGELKVYVDPGPAGAAYLAGFNQLDPGERDTIWQSHHDEVTGRLDWFMVPVPSGARSVDLTLKQPVFVVEGPWTIQVPVSR